MASRTQPDQAAQVCLAFIIFLLGQRLLFLLFAFYFSLLTKREIGLYCAEDTAACLARDTAFAPPLLQEGLYTVGPSLSELCCRALKLKAYLDLHQNQLFIVASAWRNCPPADPVVKHLQETYGPHWPQPFIPHQYPAFQRQEYDFH